MTMNSFWANVYGTGGGASSQAEDTEKLASIASFVKAAAEQGINVNQMSDEALAALYSQVMEKKAELEKRAGDAPPPSQEKKETPEEEKLRKAREEHEAKKEAQAKFAENDQAGRQMAHAFVHELRQIQEATQKEASAQQQVPVDNGYTNSLLNIALAHQQKLASELTEEEKKKLKEQEERAQEKKASELDEYGASRAIQILVEDNKNRALNGVGEYWDVKVAAEKLSAVLLSGPAPTVKTASVKELKDAIHVRGLELLEQIGVPVTWDNS